MHCELVVPGLLAAAELRLPAAELLLARGRRSNAGARALEQWLAESFELEGPLPAGALAVLAQGEDPGAGLWARADPVHLRVMRDHMLIMPGAAFPVHVEEAQALCAALNGHFAGRLETRILDAQHWCVRLQEDAELPSVPALAVAGRSVAPGRADALVNEIQMVLHEHPVNEAREARGEPAINSLWLWGAGRAPHKARGPWQSVSADEPAALGLARAIEARGRPLPPSGEEWLERAPEEGRHLLVLDALRLPLALGDQAQLRSRLELLEQRWFAPLLAALRSGRAGMVTIHVPDAPQAVSFETIRADLRRFWRRRRPLAGWGR